VLVTFPRDSGNGFIKRSFFETIQTLQGFAGQRLSLSALSVPLLPQPRIQIWGEFRWAEMLQVQARSVARHRESPAGPQTGVFLYERPGTAPVWVAVWYELLDDGSRRKRSKGFSFGTPRAKFSTSEQAEAAAIERRNLEEARWYSTVGVREQRRVSTL
jgi:hypothetical protein